MSISKTARVRTSGLILLSALIQACGPIVALEPKVHEYSMDGVKLLSADVSRGDDPRLSAQAEYTISPRHHLMLRLQEVNQRKDSIRVSDLERVELKLHLTRTLDPSTSQDEFDTTIRPSIQVCPITKSWMMLATWNYAHPFSKDGTWSQGGGDYDPNGCVHALRLEGQNLIFDVTRWFIDYPRGRGANYGLVVIADREWTISGEKSGSHSPRLLWKE